MKRLTAVVRIVAVSALALTFVANSALLFARVVLHDDMPKLFGFSQAIVISGSMEPTFSPGDMLIFRDTPECEPQDIVIFRRDGNFVTHRIVENVEGGYITRGDANNTEDTQLLAASDIEGKMIMVVPFVGSVISFLGTAPGLSILIVAGILLIEWQAIADKIKIITKRKAR